MAAGRHRRGRRVLQSTEPPRHTARGLHVARTTPPPSLMWERSDWFAGLTWRDEVPWPTATLAGGTTLVSGMALTGGSGPHDLEAPGSPADDATSRLR